MAKVYFDNALVALSGRVDGYVCRRLKGRTFLQRRPVFKLPWSVNQERTRSNFVLGSQYSAVVVKPDAALRELYHARGRQKRPTLNYRQVAIGDLMNAPEVEGLERARDTAKTGGRVRIIARDDFEVVRVTCAVRVVNGPVLAVGDATLQWSHLITRATYHQTKWDYQVPPPPEGCGPRVLVVTAFDRPGNFQVKEFLI